jgi:starch synthase
MHRSERLRVLYVTPELAPWAKSGGLGDVSAALPLALRALDVDVRTLVPGYPGVLSASAGAPAVAELRFDGELAPARLIASSPPQAAPLLIIECAAYYERPGNAYQDAAGNDWPDNWLRFGLLSRVAALLGSASTPLGWVPDIVHCQDWPAGLAPAYLGFAPAPSSATLMTIHNAAFQGIFPAAAVPALGLPREAYSSGGVEYYGKLSFLKAGIYYADALSTVSPTYAREIQTPEFGCGMDGLLRHRGAHLAGIVNGIDTTAWDPATDPALPQRYDASRLELKAANRAPLQRRLGLEVDKTIPLLAIVSRLVHQKGIDLLVDIAPRLMAHPAQLIVLGVGEPHIERALRVLAERFPRQLSVVIGYDEGLAHLIKAAADIFLMPSRFEPCGLSQLYSMRYGTPPVVHATGGLRDTVTDCTESTLADGMATGFVFDEPSAVALLGAVERALRTRDDATTWRKLQVNGMRRDFSWRASARRYLELFHTLAARRLPV